MRLMIIEETELNWIHTSPQCMAPPHDWRMLIGQSSSDQEVLGSELCNTGLGKDHHCLAPMTTIHFVLAHSPEAPWHGEGAGVGLKIKGYTLQTKPWEKAFLELLSSFINLNVVAVLTSLLCGNHQGGGSVPPAFACLSCDAEQVNRFRF